MFIETNYKAILAEIARVPLEKAEIKLRNKVVRVSKSNPRCFPFSKVNFLHILDTFYFLLESDVWVFIDCFSTVRGN